jgi:hypothetical protein
MKARAITIAAIGVMFAGCANDASPAPPSPPPPSSMANTIPRLAPGPHLGYINGFEFLDAVRQTAADNARIDALNAGMSIGRVQLDWTALEPRAGVFDRVGLRESLAAAALNGQSIMVTVTTLDTGSVTLPVDLESPDGERLRNGLSFDGPVVIARFQAFLDWLVPELERANVWALSIGNEAETNFANKTFENQALAFLSAGADYARSLDHDLAVTVTFTGDADVKFSKFFSALIDHLDIVAFNYYCLDGQTLTATRPSHWAADIDRLLAVTGEKEIFFQELGCPAGYSDLGGGKISPPKTIGASQELQTAFFEYTLARIVTEQRLRAATIFQLFDWSPELTSLFSEGLIPDDEPGAAVTIARLTEWLGTIGMCRWTDTSCRPAWDVFLNGLRHAREARRKS